MKTVLESCGTLGYVTGASQCLDTYANPQGSKIWILNDAFTHMQIQCNITKPQMIHISQCATAHKMWKSLENVHNNKGHQALVVFMCNFYCLAAKKGDNIIKHLNKMKASREHINMMSNPQFYIPDITFKILICQSLPSTWDNFTDAYIGSQTFNHKDPRRSINSQNFIGILKTEYNRCIGWKLESLQSKDTPQVNQIRAYKKPLLSCISQTPCMTNNTSLNTPYCKLCRREGHYTNNCDHFKKRCKNCNTFRHNKSTCFYEKITRKCKSRNSSNSGCRGKRRHFGNQSTN
jgi:hypothetical protein